MKLVSYNIRGIGGQAKKAAIRKLIREESIDLICLQETKVELWILDCVQACGGLRI